MAAYLIARVKVNNQEAYDKYRQSTPAAVAAYDGKFIVRGGRNELLEGDNPDLNRVVVIEFPSYDRAQAFYHSPEYQEILPIRLANAESQVVLVEGV